MLNDMIATIIYLGRGAWLESGKNPVGGVNAKTQYLNCANGYSNRNRLNNVTLMARYSRQKNERLFVFEGGK